ncbi:Gfo/Idh/MocA family protein [Allonocardiopsis opalescens]|uniref:Putative dehydrogenase n=1 Tax=Allonocardiopsis opalescens TaxID=1144618 RepID=A0A2T0PUA3_9ACTN|nr:Gfo/Idh/MocA family oxidoreductase [Allonocardiopsis opalescens]PRX92471.1 putative dehydrogenase [Allonocardiopsis opalescens]
MTAPVRWGILGTGTIAGVFTEDLLRLPGHEVAAVGSRTAESAERFAARHGIPRAHAGYAALAADDGVDVVYVATPHTAHHAAALECLRGGRHVLVEKPFTVSAAQARELAAEARERRLFAMEAMWTRFNPAVARLREWVAEGAIGEVRSVHADFGITVPYDPAGRLWAPELGGGALLDLGVYPLSFAWMLLGAPSQVHAVASPAPTGVDANTGVLLGYPGGAVALLHCGLQAVSAHTASVVGTAGRVEVATPFYRPTTVVLHRAGAEPEEFGCEIPGHGYTFQAEEVAARLRAGETESPAMPLAETVGIMECLDTIRERLADAQAASVTTT